MSFISKLKEQPLILLATVGITAATLGFAGGMSDWIDTLLLGGYGLLKWLVRKKRTEKSSNVLIKSFRVKKILSG